LVEELYNIFQDQILDQLGEIINPQKKLGSSPKLLKIQEKDFEFYMEKIKKVIVRFSLNRLRYLTFTRRITTTDSKK
jgi:hypothetical protein